MPFEPSRRRFLVGALAAGTTALAGCSTFGGARRTLKSRPEAGADPVELFTWRPASNAVHYDESDAERLAEELRETGSVESIEIPLVEERPSGEDGYRPAYTEVDGSYHRVRVEAEPATLERWVVWMEPLDELPAGVDYTTTPRDGLSESDAEIVDDAIAEAHVSVLEERDHEAQRAYRRGTVFFEPLDPENSDLVPDPPFEYALVEPDSEFGPEELAVRLHVEREAVETTRYTHTLDSVADGRSALVDHVESEHVVATVESDSLSEAERDLFEESTAITGYHEEGAPSEAFESVLSTLSADDLSLPEGREVASWLRFYRRDGDYFESRIRISDTSLVDIELGG
ncbi:hypothetical protein [Natronomonas gomsonensis]|uniref:hypothetical protein n=1 Tax=Natronomonas gomsonensis TaxID=1046043 RepID=UPI0015C0C553|nr:hypothetical protein [Natronomonas gomsonensis]